MSQPQFKQMRRAYGFDEVAIVPGGHHTINPDLVELSFKLNHLDFQLPFFAAAMDGVVDVRMAVEFSQHGGLAVLNLEGVQTRYDDPAPVLRGDRRGATVGSDGADAEGVFGADQAGADRRADPRDQGGGRRFRRLRNAAEHEEVRPDRRAMPASTSSSSSRP